MMGLWVWLLIVLFVLGGLLALKVPSWLRRDPRTVRPLPWPEEDEDDDWGVPSGQVPDSMRPGKDGPQAAVAKSAKD